MALCRVHEEEDEGNEGSAVWYNPHLDGAERVINEG